MAKSSEIKKAPRPNINLPEKAKLLAQVRSHCPLCQEPLFFKKKKKTLYSFEIAHIYPRQPTLHDSTILKDVPYPNDIDGEDNLIPLCLNCHEKYDKDKTIEEYNSLREIKDQIIAVDIQLDLQKENLLHNDIIRIIHKLDESCSDEKAIIPLSYNTKEVQRKLAETVSSLLLRTIKQNVAQHFIYIKNCFENIERESGNASIIATQFKLFFLKQKNIEKDNTIIYYNIIEWILIQSQCNNREAAAIIVAYFIQNCEVFE